MKITVEDVLSWDPCKGWDESTIRSAFRGKNEINVLDVFNLDIEDVSKLFLLLRTPFFTEDELNWLSESYEKHFRFLFKRKIGSDPTVALILNKCEIWKNNSNPSKKCQMISVYCDALGEKQTQFHLQEAKQILISKK